MGERGLAQAVSSVHSFRWYLPGVGKEPYPLSIGERFVVQRKLANTFPKEWMRNIPAKLTNSTCIYYGEAYREKELDSSGESMNLAELWVLSDRSVAAYFSFSYVSVVVWPGEIAGLRGLLLYVLGAAVGLVGLEPTISPLWAVRFNQLNYKPFPIYGSIHAIHSLRAGSVWFS